MFAFAIDFFYEITGLTDFFYQLFNNLAAFFTGKSSVVCDNLLGVVVVCFNIYDLTGCVIIDRDFRVDSDSEYATFSNGCSCFCNYKAIDIICKLMPTNYLMTDLGVSDPRWFTICIAFNLVLWLLLAGVTYKKKEI